MKPMPELGILQIRLKNAPSWKKSVVPGGEKGVPGFQQGPFHVLLLAACPAQLQALLKLLDLS